MDGSHHGHGGAGQGQGARTAAKGGSHMPPVVGGYIVGDLLGKGGFGEVW